jgi:hypothetical protein
VTEHDDEDMSADSGVKVVGGPAPVPALEPEPEADVAADLPTERSERTRRAAAARPAPRGRRSTMVLGAVAAVSLILAVTFGILYVTKSSSGPSPQDPTVLSASKMFLNAFFNVNAKTVDANFNRVTAMATGKFASQADQFFNSAIRTQLQKALAVSQGQVRLQYVQKEDASQTTAEVYAVVDQAYVNNKITAPQSDVVRLILDLQKVGPSWKISNVSVLEGPSPASVGTPSGSAGSSVPGQ